MSLERLSARGHTFGLTDVFIHHVTWKRAPRGRKAGQTLLSMASRLSEVTGADSRPLPQVKLSSQVDELLQAPNHMNYRQIVIWPLAASLLL